MILITNTAEETAALGKRLAPLLQAGDVIAFSVTSAPEKPPLPAALPRDLG